MPRTIYFEGRTIQVPDDFSDEEISGILSEGATPKQAAGAKPVDPRFFAPMSPVSAGPASPPRRFFTTMSPPASEGKTDPSDAGQDSSATRLGMSMFYASQQDPGQYARLLHLQDLTGIPPIVSAGNETEIQQWVNATRIDPQTFTTIAPNTAMWASDPDNAAVSGVDEILRLGRMEQNAAAMRAGPNLNTFLNRYGNAAIPTLADDPQVQARKRVASFWGPLGNGLVDPLVAAANQALARQHAGDSAYRATPRPEPATIAEEAQQATTPRALQVYTPQPPTIAPLPAAPMPGMQIPGVTQTLAPGLTDFASSIWHNIVGGESDSQRETRETYARVTVGQSHEGGKAQRARALAVNLIQSPLFTAEDIERHLGTDFTPEQMAKALSAQDSVRVGRITPDQLDTETRNLYDQLETGTQAVRASLPALFASSGANIPTPVLESTIDFAGGMLSPSNVAIMAALPESRVLSGLFALQGIKASYDAATEALHAYRSSDKDRAARFATTAVLNAVAGGMAGLHVARGATGGLGYERAASEGLSEGAREVMGGSAATEPVADSAFFENLSQAMAEVADSKLRGRAPRRFYQALQAIFQGHDSLQIPVERFNDYFRGKSIDPAAVAREIGADNYADVASTPGANVGVPTENFLGKLDPEHQRGLLPDVVDPASGITLRQHQGMQQGAAAVGPAKLQAELQWSHSETEATPEWQAMHEDLRQQYADAGQTPDDAETMATRDANAYSTLARKMGMQPAELLDTYAKLREWDAPGFNYPYDFETAEGIAEGHNRANTQARVLPEDKNGYAAIALNPDAYAFLRKQSPKDLGRAHWSGAQIHPSSVSGLVNHIENVAVGLPEAEKTPLLALVQAIRENRTPFGGAILIRDGMSAWQEGMARAEETGHSLQDVYRVPDKDWLDKYPEIAERAKQALRGPYKEGELPDEISAKLFAGDRMGLSVEEAERLIKAYLGAIYKHHGIKGLSEFLRFEGNKERFYGKQP